jgi:hypothetical protein
MELTNHMAEKIIQEQESIIGPIALEQARKVEGLEVVSDDNVKIIGNAKDVLAKLVDQYANLFGQASVEVCREAVRGLIAQVPKDQIPQILV